MKLIIDDESILENPEESLKQAFIIANAHYQAESSVASLTSGSSALVVLIIKKTVYIANCGNSRAIISVKKGRHSIKLTKDHNLSNPQELRRI